MNDKLELYDYQPNPAWDKNTREWWEAMQLVRDLCDMVDVIERRYREVYDVARDFTTRSAMEKTRIYERYHTLRDITCTAYALRQSMAVLAEAEYTFVEGARQAMREDAAKLDQEDA